MLRMLLNGLRKRQNKKHRLFVSPNYLLHSISVSQKILIIMILPSLLTVRQLVRFLKLPLKIKWLLLRRFLRNAQWASITTVLQLLMPMEKYQDFIVKCTFPTILLIMKNFISLPVILVLKLLIQNLVKSEH